jgi:hypothetical protein
MSTSVKLLKNKIMKRKERDGEDFIENLSKKNFLMNNNVSSLGTKNLLDRELTDDDMRSVFQVMEQSVISKKKMQTRRGKSRGKSKTNKKPVETIKKIDQVIDKDDLKNQLLIPGEISLKKFSNNLEVRSISQKEQINIEHKNQNSGDLKMEKISSSETEKSCESKKNPFSSNFIDLSKLPLKIPKENSLLPPTAEDLMPKKMKRRAGKRVQRYASK